MIKFGPVTMAAIEAAAKALSDLSAAIEEEHDIAAEPARMIANRARFSLLPLMRIEQVRAILASIEAGHPIAENDQRLLRQVRDTASAEALGLDAEQFAVTIENLYQGS
jgi:hypothetical protein